MRRRIRQRQRRCAGAASFTASAKLAVHGWMAQSIKPGLVPETVFSC